MYASLTMPHQTIDDLMVRSLQYSVQVHINNGGMYLVLTPEEARRLGSEILACAGECEANQKLMDRWDELRKAEDELTQREEEAASPFEEVGG